MHFQSDGFTFVIDPLTSRDACTEPDRLLEFCQEHPDLPTTVAYLRILGRLSAAEARGRRMIDAADSMAHRAAAVARLAHVLQWQSRHAEALRLFDTVLEEPALPDELRAQVHLHRARCCAERGDIGGTRADIARAMSLSAGKDTPTARETAASARALLATLPPAPR